MTSIADIESLGGIDFADVIRDADQLDTVRGEEVGRRSGARRRKPRR
jgi:hypothetical protein